MKPETVKKLLSFIPTGLGWSEWRAVMAAVRAAVQHDATACQLLEEWDPCDKRSGSYQNQFRTLTLRSSPGYLVNQAKLHGYIPEKQTPADAVKATLTVESKPNITQNGRGFVFDARSSGGKWMTAWISVADGYDLKAGDTIRVAGTPKPSGHGIFFLIHNKEK